ncbi:hypothetical protein DSM43518_00482 [Mycobacterium marinum]|uniref:Uncharacterized protein n=1 Tax=Mycobacterium marinum TaxID=1781 RepID=A0A3E2MUT1_MYCMR|nr:hypothetical protein DE4381_00005 [Mycobacterium marinum]RFZ15144.1 hypothetical protein DSM43518_00482 [Mycobacterium marinum]RFZ18377.1 hypothetical protein DSM43519_04195 [Mycobacterium marinum]RFZ18981.1 hypothetical protein VIMS_01312 [Mycobacterium marinum]RFZ23597.1 hypothetical protein DSM44344_03096 [Mycobacterium marinum]
MSTVTAGPCNRMAYEIRPEAKQELVPVFPYGPSKVFASTCTNW